MPSLKGNSFRSVLHMPEECDWKSINLYVLVGFYSAEAMSAKIHFAFLLYLRAVK